MSDEDIDAFLAHHGVKGMRWGVRNDKKPKGNSRVGSNDAAPVLALYGGLLGVTVLATSIHNAKESGRFNSMAIRGKKFFSGRKSYFKAKPELAEKNMSSDNIISKVVKPINPGSGLGSKANCRRCTFAYEMRRRGYDVSATETKFAKGGTTKELFRATHVDNPDNETLKQFMGSSKWGKNKSTPNTVFSDLAKQPKGSRGDLSFGWGIGGGHSVAWENIKGKPVIFDAQSGKAVKNVKEFDQIFNGKHINDMAFTRLDNTRLNDRNLTRWLKDAA